MPELPEVETTRRGIAPACEQETIEAVILRTPKLRWEIEPRLPEILTGQKILSVGRRGKYLLLQTAVGTLIIHLGMSGTLRVLPRNAAVQKHDHVDILLTSGQLLRLNDPRRFGAVLWHPVEAGNINDHKLLGKLAPEPFDDAFNGNYFYRKVHNRRVAVKSLVMNSEIVVGAGNIYANESLFLSGIHPQTPGNQLSQKQCEILVGNIKAVLNRAVRQGGTTLKDFMSPEGKPGYFAQELHVYGKEGEACPHCGHCIQKVIINQRASFFCPQCQPLKKPRRPKKSREA
ncbi:bifunctional DNA-formamidopyrimidine glycosylase/DNA-(apurinic or apyrimidinic site) lyase [Thiomicrorhabdus sp. 6S3-12]|uniref:bifunctional DNA-formamidopyrimidine glycosylase/DNA-(apurinic or apyrimidinic site) lyase n=1 Tax=Thiomicrorhabdus sp. 6S3-12 TaxID=2819681 RepID=UPI001AAD25AB|nr:bifunctional DNA-formamidopyrimidine glycosylase/DNA-(apurinic or apyrimidinic site) lyase [Thiomicrorhabdus sp. 6S3-12]MBO1925059.1 bifunctional DNA-formamidopyrimidine glycosylase/DNA-(apurinic or apyrimidinic site) lyase [Thiomicrorhabdus sp. 6S3-12]